MKFMFIAILVAILLILLLVTMPTAFPAPIKTTDTIPINSVADIAMTVGACGMRPPQLE